MIFQFYLHQLHHLHFIIPIPLLKSSMMTLSIFTSTHMISTLHPTFHPLKLINSHSRFSKISISSILTDSSWIFILQILHCIFYSHIKYNSLTIPWSPHPFSSNSPFSWFSHLEKLRRHETHELPENYLNTKIYIFLPISILSLSNHFNFTNYLILNTLQHRIFNSEVHFT